MPLFFVHFRSGERLDEDTIGVDLPDFDAVRREATWAVADLVRDAVLRGIAVVGDAFAIVDRDGRPVLTVPFGALGDEGRAG